VFWLLRVSHQKEDCVEFDLKYRGPLHAATSSNKRVPEKHQIRQSVREQLEVLWRKDARFGGIDPGMLQQGKMKGGRFDVNRPINGPADWFYHHGVAGIQFVPLITHIREARCRLSIRLFRRQPPGEIISKDGDLDNRLKTLFDALRMPHNVDELPQGIPLGPSPFLCLLDDDALITKVGIETFGLLTPPGAGEDADYVELDIGVEVVPVTPMWGTIDWLFP
jgi:hypothetical protein